MFEPAIISRRRLFPTVILTLLSLPIALSQATRPCLSACTRNTTDLCSNVNFNKISSCIDSTCHSSAEANAANTTIYLAPKSDASCLPTGELGTQPIWLKLDSYANCINSNSNFKGLLPTEAPGNEAPAQWQSSAVQQCDVIVYEKKDCAGGLTVLQVSNVQNNRCMTQSGRSVRMSCSGVNAEAAGRYTLSSMT